MSDAAIIKAFGEGPSSELVLGLMDVARDYRDDPDFRARLEADPRATLEERGVLDTQDAGPTAADGEIRLAVNTAEVFHLCLPQNPNAVVADKVLTGVAGGSGDSSVSTAGTVGSAGCASTAPSCFGTASSTSSIGSGGTASAQN